MVTHRARAAVLLVLLLASCATAPLSIEEERKLGAEVEREARTQLDFVHDEGVVGCCATAPLSIEEERKLGAEVEREARTQLDFVHDEVVVGYVAGLGSDLLLVMGPQPFDYDFYVVQDKELNAFAMPAGSVYVHTGLILKARNVSELIGVMGHEIGHVYYRHVASNYRRQRNTGIARTLGVLAVGVLAGGTAAQA